MSCRHQWSTTTLIFVLFFQGYLGQLIQVPCPLEQQGFQCNCTEAEELFEMTCDEFSIRVQPGEIVSVLCLSGYIQPPSISFEPIIRFTSCPLPNNSYANLIQGSISENSTFSLRNVSESSLLTSSHFLNMENLTSLDLALNNITNLSEHLFENLPLLTFLDLSNNKLKIMPSKLFQYTTKLEYLYLENNVLSDISENLFSNLSALSHLNLSKNKIKYLNISVFDDLINLQSLDLSNNLLRYIPSDTFNKLRAIKFIDISDNYFSRINILTFFDLNNLTEISINGNLKPNNVTDESEWIEGHERQLDLSNYLFANLAKLNKISMANSGLSQLPRFMVRHVSSLQELDVHDNSLTTIPRFMLQDCTALEVIDASENAISELPRDLFPEFLPLRELRLEYNYLETLPMSYTAYSNLQVLHLNNNNFTTLPRFLFRQLRDSTTLRSVTLARNPWQCDCKLKDLVNFIQMNEHVISDLKNVRCSDGRNMSELTDEELCNIIDV